MTGGDANVHREGPPPLFPNLQPSNSTVDPEPLINAPEFPVWTDNKARFIMRYLRYFVFITKHGTYIDGFAGPQDESPDGPWAARFVLESEPKWMKHFHLCDANRTQIKRLKALKAVQPERDSKGQRVVRDITIHHGDFNLTVDRVLAKAAITEKEATFCLLDQRTFECEWPTVEKLAHHKQTGHKIELFYFLANGWLERALAGQKDKKKLERWWGRADWPQLRQMTRDQRRDAIVSRMKLDLGYKSVKAWPIYERQSGGAIMYYMIHATDHPEAPTQMSRAYRKAVSSTDQPVQGKLWSDPDTQTSDTSEQIETS